jgi:hypothetical protein
MLTNLFSHRLLTLRGEEELLDLSAPIWCVRQQRSAVSVEMNLLWLPAYLFVVAIDLIFTRGGRL